jgi:pyrimidine-specific ribonucleoside hydrolase
MTTPVLLDVDTGVDDAMALLLAVRHPELDLLAVTCVAGNAPVEQVVRNTCIVLDAAGAGDVPVAQGAARPLIESPRTARHVHGEDGMADLGWPASPRRPVDEPAVALMARTLADAPAPVTLVALAPLTNVALLLRTHPRATERIARLVMVGGATGGGNATAAAEFNVWHDPEAAAIVLGSGLPITMYGLDVFYEVTLGRDTAARLAASTDPAARLAAGLLTHQLERFFDGAATIGDAGAVAAVVEPDALTTERLPVRVELAGTLTRGQTVVDRRPWSGDEQHDPYGSAYPLVDLALAVDADRYRRIYLSVLDG